MSTLYPDWSRTSFDIVKSNSYGNDSESDFSGPPVKNSDSDSGAVF